MDTDTTEIGWAIVEQLGHRRIAGHVREVEIAGAGFLRVDIPGPDGQDGHTVIASPSSVYALHPVDESVARAVAARCNPEPVHRWELRELAPAPTLQPRMDQSDYDHDDEDEDEETWAPILVPGDEGDLVTTVQPRGDLL